MGLDMYLEKKTNVKNYGYEKKSERHSILVKRGGKKRDDIDPKNISQIVEEIGYWRKANAIHNWFVENVQDGEDDCGEHSVERSQLQELLELCNKVIDASILVKGKIKNGQTGTKDGWVDNMVDGSYIKDPKVAKELLPVSEGFFFGSYDYDEYYLETIKDTKKILEEGLKGKDDDWNVEYYYSSSW